ncbi:MAG: type 4 prepilin peptidase 1, Aspartic peptidase, family [Deltaproteobacteria bacterium]|nr:type 4 prepilin peptidase 1, Aspartic peptidase, family [Deltaproteobacteria bacterium]
MTLAFVFAFGAIIGSFLNVCIARLPDGRSIVRPPSHCPKCQSFLAWYDNVPILSYLVLGGRCRTCRVRISAIYPAVEVLTGALAVALFLRLGPTLAFAGYFAFAAALVVITFIDLDHQLIPDVISLPGIVVGLAFSLVSPLVTPLDAALGVLAGGGTLLAVAWLYKTFRGQEGMGGGDIKLLAMIGAFLGWQSIFVTLFVGSVIGSIIGVGLMLYQRADTKLAIPFGPFLAGGALVYLFWGDRILAFYFGS